MTEAVTDIIVARARGAEGLRTMLLASAAAHAVLLGALALTPRSGADDEVRTVMTISLGAAGPRTGGMTQMGGRSVQQAEPEAAVRRTEAPAPARPAMTLPDPRARARPQARARQAPAEAASRAESTGERPVEGSTRTDTGVRGQGFGLSGGGGAFGASATVDVANFCCPDYLEQVITLIERNWDQNQGVPGAAAVKFTILKNGAVQQPAVERSSGYQILDMAALRAVQLARLPPLPAEFAHPSLTVHVTFQYQR